MAVLQLAEKNGEDQFLASCECGWSLAPRPTREEALVDAYGHDLNVVDGFETGPEGGTGWLCFFCGEVIDQDPVRLSMSWGRDEDEDGQLFAAHRDCVIKHASGDETIRGGPLFTL